MYSKESEFSAAITAAFVRMGYMVTKIESHNTINGIPDLFVTGHGKEQWIELKTDPRVSIHAVTFKIAWRPGQQSWYYQYKLHSNRAVVTLMSCADGFVIVQNDHVFEHNLVSKDNCITVKFEDGLKSLIELVM